MKKILYVTILVGLFMACDKAKHGKVVNKKYCFGYIRKELIFLQDSSKAVLTDTVYPVWVISVQGPVNTRGYATKYEVTVSQKTFDTIPIGSRVKVVKDSVFTMSK